VALIPALCEVTGTTSSQELVTELQRILKAKHKAGKHDPDKCDLCEQLVEFTYFELVSACSVFCANADGHQLLQQGPALCGQPPTSPCWV
jgi:hypothetical protein